MKLALSVLTCALCISAAPLLAQDKPYKVADGNQVDSKTLEGFRTWRALQCERCHGPNQEGMVGPSLIETMKTMTPEQFKKSVLQGKPEKGMPNFDGSKMVVDNIDGLYAFLKGRSDGAIKPGRLQELK
jgi:mono/diheme cytochrome c family protein